MAGPVSDTPKRRWPKRLAITMITVLALLVLALLVLRIALRSETGRSFVEHRIEQMQPAGQTLEIEGLDGDLLGGFTIERLQISDAQGVWASAQDVQLVWSPGALWRRNLVIDQVFAQNVDIARRPIIESSAEGSGKGSPLKTVILSDLSLPQIALAEPLIGQALDISATGRAKHSQSGGSLVLNAQSAQGTDMADIDLSWSPETLLSGRADLRGEAGGVFAALIAAPNSAITAQISTTGPPQSSETQIDASINGAALIAARISLNDRNGNLSGTVFPARHPAARAVGNWISAPVEFNANLADVGTTAMAGDVRLSHAQDTANARLIVQRDGIALTSLDVRVSRPLRGLEDAPAKIGALAFNGEAQIGDMINLRGNLELFDIIYDQNTVEALSGPIIVSQSGGTTGFDVNMTGQGVSGPRAELLGGAPKLAAQGELSGSRLDLARANINLPGAQLSAKGRVTLDDIVRSDLSGRYNLNSQILRDSPSAQLSGTFALAPQDGQTRIKVDGQAQDISGLPAPLPDLLGESVTYSGVILMKSAQDFYIRKLGIDGQNANLTASGQISQDRLNLDAKINTGPITVGSADISALDGTAQITGTTSRPEFQINAAAPQIIASGQTLDKVDLILDGNYDAQQIRAEFDLKAERGGEPVELSGNALYKDGQWDAQDVNGQFSGLTLNGQISGQGGDIDALRADFTVSGTGVLDTPTGVLNAKVMLGERRVQIDAALADINIAPLQGARLTLKASGPRDAVALTATLTGEAQVAQITRPLDTGLSATLDLTDGLTARAELEASMGRYTVQTERPAVLNAKGGQWSLDAEVMTLGGTVTFAHTPDQLEKVDIRIEGLEIAQILGLMGRPELGGTISGEAHIIGQTAQLNGQLSGLRQPEEDNFEPINAKVTANIENAALTARLSTESPLLFETRLFGPVIPLQNFPYFRLPPNAQLTGQSKIDGEIGPLAEFVLPPEMDISGDAQGNVTFALPFSPDQLNGQLDVTGGRFEQGTLGFVLADIDVGLDMSERRISARNLSATDGDGGTLRGDGSLRMGERLTGGIKMEASNLKTV